MSMKDFQPVGLADVPENKQYLTDFQPVGIAAGMPQPAKPEQADGVIDTLGQGFKNTGRAIGATIDTYIGDTGAVVESAKTNQEQAKLQDQRVQNFHSDFQKEIDPELDGLAAVWDATKAVGSAAWDNPAGAGLALVEQLPNAIPGLAAGYAGAKVGAAGGAAVGSVVPGAGTAVGAGIGGTVGFFAGMFAGNTAIETGHKAMEKASDGEFTDIERQEAMTEGAKKGATIAAVDTLTLRLGGAVSNGMQRTTVAAMDAATRKALVDKGIDITSQAAVMAARQNPEILQAVQLAQRNAVKATDKLAKRAAEAGTLLTMETVGEGVGEYLGEIAATGEADISDAVLEAAMGFGQSSIEAGYNMVKSREAQGVWGEQSNSNDIGIASGLIQPTPTPDNPNPAPVNRPDPSNGPISAAAAKMAPVQTAEDLGVQFPEQQDWSQYEQPAVKRGVEAERGYDGLDGLIATTERMGFTDEAAQLITARRLFQQAEQARAAGDEALAGQYAERGNRLYQSATETNDQIKSAADQFPVPYVATGEVTGSDLGPYQGGPERTGNTFDQPRRMADPTPGLLEQRQDNRLTDQGIIYGEEPAGVRTAREQRAADDFSARYGQEGRTPLQSDPAREGDFIQSGTITDEGRMLPNQYQRPAQLEDNRMDALPEGTGQMDMGRDRPERTFTPTPTEYEGVGRNVVERQAGLDVARLENRKTITQGEMIELTRQFREAVTTKPVNRTDEQKQLIKALPKLKKQVNAGAVPVTQNMQSDLDPQLAGQPIDAEWTEFAPQSGTLNVPRAQMPQVKAEHRGALVNFLSAKGVGSEQIEVDPVQLKPTQQEFSPEKVDKARQYKGGERSILISSDGHVVDGHHQWMAKREQGEPVKAIQLQAPIRELLPMVSEFPSSAQDGGAVTTADTPSTAQSAAPELRMKSDGTPFASEVAAKRSMPYKQNAEFAEVVPVDGGYAVRIDTQARDQAETRAAEQQQARSEQAKLQMYRPIDTAKDDLLDAIALSGGISRPEAEGNRIDPDNFKLRAAGIRWVFPANGGASFDEMAEHLAQFGYLDPRAERKTDLQDKVALAINQGRKIMTPEGYEALAEKMIEAEAQLQEEHAPLADDITSDEAWAGEAYAMAAEAGVPINVIDAILEQYSADPIATLVELNDAINEVENARAAQAGEGTQGRSADTEIPWNEPGNLSDAEINAIFGEPEQDAEPLLTSYTESDLQAQADAQSAAEQAEADAQRRAEQKAQADAEVGDFTLSGSNRPADVAASRGQNDMFGLGGTPRSEQPVAQQQPEPETPEPVKSRVSVDTFNSWKRQGTAGTRKGWTIFKDDVRNQYALMRKTLDENAAGGGYEGADMVSGFTTRAKAEEWIDENAQQSAPQQQVDPEAAGQPVQQQAETEATEQSASPATDRDTVLEIFRQLGRDWPNVTDIAVAGNNDGSVFKRVRAALNNPKLTSEDLRAIVSKDERKAAFEQGQQEASQKAGETLSDETTVTANGITVEVPTIDQQLVDDYNRATHMGRGRDLNAELRSEAEGLLNELAERKYTLDTPEQKTEAKRLIEAYLQAQAEFSQWDARYSANNPSWIVTGRSGRNMDKSNRANERHMDEYTKRVDRLQASRDRIAERLYNMRPQEVQENQALMADLRETTRMTGTILADIDSKVLAAETRKWASPKAHKLIERSLEADRRRTIEHIRELENTKAVQDAGGLVKVFGPRSKAGKLVKELLAEEAPRFSRSEDNSVDPEYTPGKANTFWEGLNNGTLRRGSGNSRLAQRKWVEENLTAGFGYQRGQLRVVAGRAGSGLETIRFERGIAGFQGVVTSGRVSQSPIGNEAFVFTVTPVELLSSQGREGAAALTITLTETKPNQYEVGISGPLEGGAAAQALAGTEYLSDTGNTSQQGVKYLKLNIGNAATKSFLSEAVRRLAMHNGRAPDAVLYSARDTGARAGDQTVRKFSRDIIEKRFRQDQSSAKDGMTVKDAQRVVNRLSLGWKNKPKINVVASKNELPGDARDNRNGTTKGLYFNGEIYIVADAAADEKSIQSTLYHEILGHYGLRQMLGDRFNATMADTFSKLGGLNGIRDISAKYGFDLEPYIEKSGDPDAKKISTRIMLADEVIAFVAGTNPSEPSLVERIAIVFRKALRTLLGKSLLGKRIDQYSDAELRQIVTDAKRAVTQDRVDQQVRRYREDNPNLLEWAKGTAIKNHDTGEPYVVYHGTKADISTFEPQIQKNGPYSGLGFFFSPDHNVAEVYAGEDAGSNIMPVYLNIKSPLFVEDDFSSDTFNIDNYETFVMYREMIEEEGFESGRAWLESEGYDGIVLRGMDGGQTENPNDTNPRDQLIALRPEQIKSAIGNNGGFDQGNPDIRFQMETRDSEELPADEAPHRSIRSSVNDRLDGLRFQIQDKLIDLKRKQEEVGSDAIDDSINAYQKAAIWEGRAGERLSDFDEERVQPLLDQVAQTGLSLSEVGEWLVARHAEEANAYLAEINPDKADSERYRLSGMSNDEAQAILAQHADNAALQQVGEQVDQINRDRVAMLVNEGLITQDMADAWQSRYQNYVPLNREEADTADRLPSRGKGFQIKGKETKQRTGSAYWRPDKILSHVIANYESSIVRAEKNKVGEALLKFAEANPDENFWAVDAERTTRTVRNGKVVEGAKLWDAPNELTVKRDGVEHVLVFNPNNKRAMRLVSGLKNLQAAEMNTAMQALAKVTRFLATINTSFNPEFMVSNFIRDIQTAGYNLSNTELKNMELKVIKDVFPAMGGIRKALFGDGSGEWAAVWEDFRKHGGKTGWLDLHSDIKEKEQNLTRIVERIRKGKAPKHLFRRFLNGIEDMNNVVENGVRVSAYKHALDAGLSKEQAAALAKDLTVNFNRKGAMGPQLNAFYMFFNAAVQGNVRLIQAIANSKKGRALALGTVGFAVMLDIINRSIAGDDDDGENAYDALPDYVKDRNIIIMKPGGTEPLIKLPAPWGYNTLHVAGQEVGKAISGDRFDPLDSGARVAMAFVDAFNPMGSGSISQMIAPTVVDPIVQVAENKNFSGNPLMPEHTFDAFQPRPEYQMHFSSAREGSKAVAKWLNDVSGGNTVRPGAINISPEVLDLVVDTTTGGLGRMLGDSADFTTRLVTGKEIELENVPFLRKVTGFNTDYGVKGRYYEWSKNVGYAKDEARRLRGRDLIEARQQPAFRMIGFYTQTDKQLKALRKRRKAAEAAGASDAMIERIDEQIRRVMARFNRRYAEVVLK